MIYCLFQITTVCWFGSYSMFSGSYIARVLCYQVPVFTIFYVPNVLYSQCSLFPGAYIYMLSRPCIHRVICSQGPSSTGSYVPRGLYSHFPMFQGPYIPRAWYSLGPMLTGPYCIFAVSYVTRPIDLQGHMFPGPYIQCYMFPGAYIHIFICSKSHIPKVLYSQGAMFPRPGTVFTGSYVNRALYLQDPMFSGSCPSRAC